MNPLASIPTATTSTGASASTSAAATIDPASAAAPPRPAAPTAPLAPLPATPRPPAAALAAGGAPAAALAVHRDRATVPAEKLPYKDRPAPEQLALALGYGRDVHYSAQFRGAWLATAGLLQYGLARRHEDVADAFFVIQDAVKLAPLDPRVATARGFAALEYLRLGFFQKLGAKNFLSDAAERLGRTMPDLDREVRQARAVLASLPALEPDAQKILTELSEKLR
jgi:hypothetical protein